MITSLKFNNCFAFNNSIEMNLRADMRTKKFASNIININEKLNVLKSAVIYGPNNTGKTTLINSIKAIKIRGTAACGSPYFLGKMVNWDINYLTNSKSSSSIKI